MNLDPNDPDIQAILQRPDLSLQTWGKVQNIEDEGEVDYDPYAITEKGQATILSYFCDPPRNELGETLWLIDLKSRQGGHSTTVASVGYAWTQYHPGWEHVTTADTKERADYLFDKVSYLHGRWPESLKVPQLSHNQTRAFRWENSSKMIVRSGGSGGLGIGMSASSWHWSEVPFWKNAAKQWSYAYPAMKNRKNMRLIMEFTPSPLSEPSAQFAMEICEAARDGKGRLLYSFFPFWDGKTNRRPWRKGDHLTIEEQRLLDRYGHLGLRKENLAFRRSVMDEEPEIRRNPDLFRIFYPFDDLTCWMHGSGGVIHARHIERHLRGLVDWPSEKDWKIYENPKPGANYVIGVDPSGYGARDHASFQVLEIWGGSWRQVATYAGQADPPEFAKMVDRSGRKYNNALVCVESNGVGLGTITLLQQMDYPNLFWTSRDRPGLHKNNESEFLAKLIDALNETLVLRDRKTVAQLRSYRADRSLERSIESEILGFGSSGGRRTRDHWDRVSALMIAVMVADTLPQNRAPSEALSFENVVPFGEMTVNDILIYEQKKREFDAKQGGRRGTRSKSVYRSRRRRR